MEQDYTRGKSVGRDYILYGVEHFSLVDILECGQCFRWDKLEDGSFHGIAFGRSLRISQREDSLIFHDTDEREFLSVWFDYFDFGRSYRRVKEILGKDRTLRRAIDFAPGLRVLRQDGWEALCSFILSQNNNIPRIRGLVRRLCELCGEPVGDDFAFPTPERLSGMSQEELAPVRSGFRAGYILDAARQVSSGAIGLESLRELPTAQARESLQRIRGVGPKVANCALLYGFGRADCLPVDVWINRALSEHYPHGLPADMLPIAGLAQQYLFHYTRNAATLPA